MATGLQAYDALHAVIRHLAAGSVWVVNTLDVYDLGKLTAADLMSRGYDEEIANEVSTALLKGNLWPLAQRMGLANLTISPIALRLTEPKPSRADRETQLREMLTTHRGKDDVLGLLSCFLDGASLRSGSRMLQA